MIDMMIILLLSSYVGYIIYRMIKKKKTMSKCDGHCLGCPYK